MDQDTKLIVTDKGAIIMPKGRLAKPGDTVTVAEFKGYEAQLEILCEAGNLSQESVQVTGIDTERVSDEDRLPALETELDGKNAPRSVSGANEAQTQAQLAEIKAQQEQREQQAAQQKAALAQVGADAELTPEEAQELGIMKPN